MFTMQEYHLQDALIEVVIDNLPTAIIVLDRNTSIVLANNMATDFSKKSKEHLFGMRGGEAFGCIHVNDDPKGCGYGGKCRECVIRNTVEQTFMFKINQSNIEAPMTFIDLGNRILSVSTTWLAENDLAIVALNDITDVKKQEELKNEKSKLQAAVATGGAVCHEMNQPLSVIIGYIELLEMEHEHNSSDSSRGHEYFDIIKTQVMRMGEFTKKLMSISRFSETEYACDSILDINKSSDGKIDLE